MKKNYMKPLMEVVKLQHQGIICTSPGSVTSISTNLDEADKFILGGSDEDYLGEGR